MRTIEAVVIRQSRDEKTVAIVKATVADDFGSDDDAAHDDVTTLYGHIQLAVTDWFRETDTGKAAVRGSSYDLNVGDLADWCDDKTLVPFLRKQGIRRLRIETHSDTHGHHWDYDDVLFDQMEITAETDHLPAAKKRRVRRTK